MGSRLLDRHLKESDFLRRHKLADITSVYPSTTTAATTSVITGKTPAQHGWLGWNLYFPEEDKTISLYPNTDKLTGEPVADYPVALTLMPYEKIFDKIKAGGEYDAFYVEPYKGIPYDQDNIDEMLEIIKELAARPGNKFIHGYLYEPDHLIHEAGADAPAVTEKIKMINDKTKALCEELSNTLVIVTADHGLLDVEYVAVSEHPALQETLLRETSIEPRGCTFFVKPGMEGQFEREFKKAFGDDFLLLSKAQVKERKIFGEGEEHPHFDKSLGDYLALSVSNKCINDTADTFKLTATHAGLLEDEMVVPVIAIDCDEI